MNTKYHVGDRVYFINRFDEIYWWLYYKTPPERTKYPIQKKITQVVNSKEGILYQVKGGHFPESWVGDIVFDTEEEAKEAIKAGKGVTPVMEPMFDEFSHVTERG